MPFKSILVPIDVDHRSSWECALPQAIELAAAGQGSVTVVTVIEDLRSVLEGENFPFDLEFLQLEACNKLREIVSAYRGRNVLLTEQVRFGKVGHQVLEVAQEQSSDLIVMESHRSELRTHLIGPSVKYVAQHANCSVLILRRFE
jgi:nucleotide-binding universal stress UspA family protein